MWQVKDDNHIVNYSHAALLTFLSKALIKNNLTHDEDLLIALLAKQLEVSSPEDLSLPSVIYASFVLGYEYAKFMERENVTLLRDSNQTN